jgi:hypothetical protein
VEVEFDHVTNGRFRHGTRFLRWRPDKDPRACTFDQIAPGRFVRGSLPSAGEAAAPAPAAARSPEGGGAPASRKKAGTPRRPRDGARKRVRGDAA